MEFVQMTLTPHQQEVFDNIVGDMNKYNSFLQSYEGSLTGPAGVGKTVLMASLVKYFIHNLEGTIAVTTPTHKALAVLKETLCSYGVDIYDDRKINMRTIHSYLGLKLETKEDKRVLVQDNFRNRYENTMIIVDESSMVSEEVYSLIKEELIKSPTTKYVLFCGDKFQLLPVEGKQNPIYKSENQYELTEVVRQAKDSPILSYATRIREEIQNKTYDLSVLSNIQNCDAIQIYNNHSDFIESYCVNNNEDKLMLSFTNKMVEAYNKTAREFEFDHLEFIPEYIEGEKLVFQEMYGKVMNNEEVIIRGLDKYVDEEYNILVWSFLYEGGSKTQTIKIVAEESKNDFNGQINLIAEMAKEAKRKKQYYESKNFWDSFWKHKEQFADVKHAYAMTVHKSQGSSLTETYFNLNETITMLKSRDLDMLFRLAYVAVTRAKKKLYVYM